MNELHAGILSILISFVLGLFLCPLLIPYLAKLKLGQHVRNDGPASHLKKSGTPTMGGVAIILSFLFSSLFFYGKNEKAFIIILITLLYALVGFLDDIIKVIKKRSLGLRAGQKILAQILIALFFCFYIKSNLRIDTVVFIPFFKVNLDFGIFYFPFILFVMLATVNAVNLTDGLDGLAGGVTMIVSTFFMLQAWSLNSGISPVLGSVIGGLLAFLLFNAHPAQVFMGDTGSLALGGLIASTAIILNMSLFIPIVGIIYVVEALSVVLQVLYFKLSKGRRIFKMAPFHHHLELSGYSETQIVMLFYVTTAMMCLIAYFGR